MITYKKIPSEYNVGGQKIEVRHVDRCDNNTAGTAFLVGGYIEIAEKCNKSDTQSESSKVNTFYHELTHTILDTMGENDLSNNEKFVSSFSSFLNEAMKDAYFAKNNLNINAKSFDFDNNPLSSFEHAMIEFYNNRPVSGDYDELRAYLHEQSQILLNIAHQTIESVTVQTENQ